MKIKELIQSLNRLDPEAEVIIFRNKGFAIDHVVDLTCGDQKTIGIISMALFKEEQPIDSKNKNGDAEN
jgi:hypothetical protein